ncbi:MAG TPA: tRNA (guanosine(46)-N7)-methyltransferase TrmB [Parachlamydiaceae bacterium]|nr:tRNA (guanosine(46)-N7)-methyltransferase TrmB [Parachlamydiaceae bacterium]
MKPEDLKSPFPFAMRQILIQDKVWFVPDYFDKYDTFTFPGFSDPQVFGNEQPVFLEYCSGNGSWIASKAKNNPLVNFVACEIKFPRVRKIWAKMKNHFLNNLFTICGEGFNITKRYFLPSSIDRVFINFPDPWPKTRHFKHRIIQTAFIEELARVLKTGGSVTFVTDDAPYSEWTIEKFLQNPAFVSHFPAPYYANELADYGTSYFEELWREKGRSIRYHQFVKKAI